MTDLKKMAAEYSVVGLAAGTSAIHRRAYMAGAKAALEVAAKIAFDGNGSDPADCAHNIAKRIRSLLPEVST